MTRLQVQAAVALLLVATALLLFSAILKEVSISKWQQPRIASWAFNMSAIDNMRHPKSLLTYGSNNEAPKFIPQSYGGARVLIFAYARQENKIL